MESSTAFDRLKDFLTKKHPSAWTDEDDEKTKMEFSHYFDVVGTLGIPRVSETRDQLKADGWIEIAYGVNMEVRLVRQTREFLEM